MNDLSPTQQDGVWQVPRSTALNRANPLGHLMHVDPDECVRFLDDGIHMANGLAFSPLAHGLRS